jgi:UDP-glucuronate 4-epimerase
MNILITGTAGFIGFHLANRLMERGDQVVGLDIINDYYDVNLKYRRLTEAGINKDEIAYGKLVQSGTYANYRFIQLDLADKEGLEQLFKTISFDTVVNLAAQAGVRYSLVNPQAYVDSNIVGFVNLLECCRHYEVGHLAYASSSSVYGLNEKMPLSTSDNVDHPISLYAASKKSNELMAHTYSHLFNLPTTGLRFFTVYGPWGRPDMALFLFTEAILKDEAIKVFNHGNISNFSCGGEK